MWQLKIWTTKNPEFGRFRYSGVLSGVYFWNKQTHSVGKMFWKQKNFNFRYLGSSGAPNVVYFDKQIHADIHADAWSKTMKNIWKLRKKGQPAFGSHLQWRWPANFFPHFSSWALHEPLMCMMKKVLFHDFRSLSLFSNMQMHAQACVCRSKYTTPQFYFFLKYFRLFLPAHHSQRMPPIQIPTVIYKPVCLFSWQKTPLLHSCSCVHSCAICPWPPWCRCPPRCRSWSRERWQRRGRDSTPLSWTDQVWKTFLVL